ncbi:hypothetical protein BJV74DRAFT_883678 [Russula compacta]|nr:hypothetical protein BJV74DRAFT_883678 [Russula compacta]
MSSTEVTRLDIPELVDRHHNEHVDEKTGQVIHVFAVAGPPPFGASSAAGEWDFNIQFSVLGLTFKLSGSVNLSTLSVSASLSIHLPFIGDVTLASVNGNLKDGVSVTFGVSGVVSGKARFYLKGKELWVDLTATIFGHSTTVSIKLITLPCVVSFW